MKNKKADARPFGTGLPYIQFSQAEYLRYLRGIPQKGGGWKPLTAAAKDLFLYLKFMSNNKNGAIYGITATTIAEHIGMLERTVYKAFAQLRQAGLITIDKKKQTIFCGFIDTQKEVNRTVKNAAITRKFKDATENV